MRHVEIMVPIPKKYQYSTDERRAWCTLIRVKELTMRTHASAMICLFGVNLGKTTLLRSSWLPIVRRWQTLLSTRRRLSGLVVPSCLESINQSIYLSQANWASSCSVLHADAGIR